MASLLNLEKKGSVLKDTTERCFDDLVSRISNVEARKVLADLLEISYESTLARWITSGVKAQGITLIRLRVLLSLLGYEVEEWENLSPLLFSVAEGLTYNLMSLEMAREGLGYTENQKVYRQILHNGGMYASREKQAKAFVASFEESLNSYRTRFQNRLQLLDPVITDLSKPQTISTDVSSVPMMQIQTMSVQEIMDAFGAQVLAILPLARFLDSDVISSEERAALRKQVGYDNMSEISLIFRELTSEKTREQIADSKRKGRIS